MIKKINHHINKIFSPRPRLTGSEFADRFFYTSSESSAIVGKWVTRPHQLEILDCMTDRRTPFVFVKKPTRVGYSIMLSIVNAFYIDNGASVLNYQPTDTEAFGFAEDTINPMIRDNPLIKNLVREDTTPKMDKKKKEKTTKKQYAGGYLEVLGASSDKNFNRRTVRVVVADEIDAWQKEVKNTGDILATMFTRTSDFVDRKNIVGGKPIGGKYEPQKEGYSQIDFLYQKGDKREYFHRCLKCNKLFNIKFFNHIKWVDKDPSSAFIECPHCEHHHINSDRIEMEKRGEWIAQDKFTGTASFWYWSILSQSPNLTLEKIVSMFLDVKNDPIKLKSFYNEVLAETFEDDYKKIKVIEAEDRREDYVAEVPEGVLALTVGVDIQKDRIELEIVGWGRNEETWSINYHRIYGDPLVGSQVWDDLNEILLKDYFTFDDKRMKIFATAIDTGSDFATKVYDFAKDKTKRKVYPIKGSSRKNDPIIASPSWSKKSKGVKFYVVGVSSVKKIISQYIEVESAGAGYMHFPKKDIYNDHYFKGLSSEVLTPKGWKKIYTRNEPLDVRGYSYIAMRLAGVDLELASEAGRRYWVI